MVPVLEPWLVPPAPALGTSTRADSFSLLHLHQQTSILDASKCCIKILLKPKILSVCLLNVRLNIRWKTVWLL